MKCLNMTKGRFYLLHDFQQTHDNFAEHLAVEEATVNNRLNQKEGNCMLHEPMPH